MTGDDIGLNFFTQHEPASPPARASAFGPVDQEALIARIDDVDEDDLTSDFFGHSILDVENAATRAFDIGIRMHGTDAPVLTTAGIDEVPAPAADHVEEPVVGDAATGARAAFILGGPTGIS